MNTQFTGGYSLQKNQQLAELATSDCWQSVSQISRMLKAKNPHKISIPKDIRNAIQVAMHNKLGRLTNVEVAVEKPQKISWRYSFFGDENGCLTYLINAPLKDYGYFRDFQLSSLWTVPTTSLR